MYPVSALPKDKQDTGGPFDVPIEKSVKAIKTHSIQSKPQKSGGKKSDPKYREFISRKEYNPFLHNAWMLMAKSQFHNGDFLQAASSFSYISRLYESQPEIAAAAKIWKARCYAELGWYYEAEDILSKVNNDKLPPSQNDWFSTVYADYLIKQKQYSDAIPYMKIAVKTEKNKLQRTREKYLLGQMYASLGQKELAYNTFGQVSSANAPYILELSAKIRQTEVYPGADTTKVTKKLKKMAKSSKNKDYLDQIYYALGNVYLSVPDTAKAIESYELGVEKSTQSGIEKTMNQIKLGDIYFEQRKYIKAQPNYAEALTQLKKESEAYPRVSKRSEVLDALVIHYEAVELQDSLQKLSKMTEEERLVVVNKIIEDLIEKEKKEQEKLEQDEYQAAQENLKAEQQSLKPQKPAMNVAPPTNKGDENLFYFYNPQVVSTGKNAFQQKWGRRKLEDDWRRKTKTNTLSDIIDPNEIAEQEGALEEDTDSLALDNPPLPEGEQALEGLSEDPKDPQFYLQQIPVTEEDLAASDLIIIDGLYNMGVIYKDMLENANLAIETLETLNTRFPENENKLQAYYHIYLAYWRLDDMVKANEYKNRIRTEFPESDLAIAMADPDYEYNLKTMEKVQDSLYVGTYSAYLDNKPLQIRENYQLVSTKYNQSKLLPKFMLLNALSFVQTNEADTFKVLLKELIEKFPSEDVSVLASEMMKGFQRGLILSASGDNMLARGSLFNIRFGAESDSLGIDSTLVFSAEKNTPHKLMLIYPKETLDENLLLFTVASFNFGSFMVNDFDLEKTENKGIGILHIKGFNNLDEVIQYIQMINQDGGYAQDLGQAVLVVPISGDNYDVLMKGKSLDEYLHFFEENFPENENLIEKWRLKQAEEMEVTEDANEEPNADDEDIEEAETIPETDKIEEVEKPEKPEAVKEEIKPETTQEVKVELEVTGDVYDDVSDGLENATQKWNKIADNPIQGIRDLFKRKSSNAIDEYAKQQEKEEKEKKKQQKKEQAEKDKAEQKLLEEQEQEKENRLKQQEEENKDLLKAQKKLEKDLAKLKIDEKKQQETAKKEAVKQKENDRKEKAKALKEAKKKKDADRKAKIKAQKEAKQKKDAERKAKAKAQKEEAKQKAKAK
jgi:tetratricopeptide (TPR) repeat protein